MVAYINSRQMKQFSCIVTRRNSCIKTPQKGADRTIEDTSHSLRMQKQVQTSLSGK